MTPFIGSDIFDFINQVSFFVKRQAKNICQASLFGRPKWPLGIFVKTHGDIQVLPKSTFIWTVIDLRLYEYQFESSSNISKYILTFLFVKYWIIPILNKPINYNTICNTLQWYAIVKLWSFKVWAFDKISS